MTGVLPVELDVTDKASIAKMLEALSAEWRDIDVLINNAGLALGIAPAQEADLDDWEVMIGTNNKGLVRMTRALLPHFVQRKEWCDHQYWFDCRFHCLPAAMSMARPRLCRSIHFEFAC